MTVTVKQNVICYVEKSGQLWSLRRGFQFVNLCELWLQVLNGGFQLYISVAGFIHLCGGYDSWVYWRMTICLFIVNFVLVFQKMFISIRVSWYEVRIVISCYLGIMFLKSPILVFKFTSFSHSETLYVSPHIISKAFSLCIIYGKLLHVCTIYFCFGDP